MKAEAIYGNYRAKVVDNKDPQKFGRVLVWIPDFMPEVDDSKGIWARPANNPIGGRNMEGDDSHHYMGSSYIPAKGSWLFVFFESGNINRPYYFGALDLENTKVLPENQLGSEYQKKWTIFKSHEGRTFIISDDPSDERVEITGKKRELTSPPSGDTSSVYKIDDNQTVILLDERSGKEKVLIRTRKGDFFHIDIDQQKLQAYFKDEIQIKSDKNILITAKEKLHLKTLQNDLYISSEGGSIHLKSAIDINEEAGGDHNIKTGGSQNTQPGCDQNVLAGRNINHDAGVDILDQQNAAASAASATNATTANPQGGRDT
jgi:hypothetical protein